MGESKGCLFCNETDTKYSQDASDNYLIRCPNCGDYIVSDIIEQQDKDTVKKYLPYKHLISGLICEKNNKGLKMEVITTKNILSLLSDPMIPKTLMQKLDKIILYFYNHTSYFGEKISIETENYAIAYAKNAEELTWMLQLLIQEKYITGRLILTFTGWKRAEELMSTNNYSNKVFVAMGFYQDLLEAHEKAIKLACENCGFKAFLISETEHNQGITDRIIAEIKTSKFVITDFTYNNCGAYFEAGYAQGRGLEVIRTCKKEWFDAKDAKGDKNKVHFDINHYNIILWESHDDLKEKLINRIRATIL